MICVAISMGLSQFVAILVAIIFRNSSKIGMFSWIFSDSVAIVAIILHLFVWSRNCQSKQFSKSLGQYITFRNGLKVSVKYFLVFISFHDTCCNFHRFVAIYRNSCCNYFQKIFKNRDVFMIVLRFLLQLSQLFCICLFGQKIVQGNNFLELWAMYHI